MKILKYLGVVLALLILTPLFIALFLKKQFTVERDIVINKPKQEVFDFIKLLKNQDSYSVWALKDPSMKKEWRGTDGTVGFVSGWDSQNDEVGKGEQEIIGIQEGQRVDYELRFFKPMEGKDNAYMTTEALSDSTTKVVWGFKGNMAYPMNLMLLFFDMEQMLGADFQNGLSNLKKEVEK
ncbi:MAG: SRPBCC family protein [Cytophagaceae bacterium]|jgi:hypothetical protein|nr:SRPBCC family protein [Cytophagaceae bacterium]